VVRLDIVNIDDRIDHVLTVVADAGGELRFDELFKDNPRRMVVVVTFMAILELIKMQEIRFRQEKQFGNIFVVRRDPATRENLSEPDDPPIAEERSETQSPAEPESPVDSTPKADDEPNESQTEQQ
jgi:chromatin segregation and condensation protein Rec8/ScpA/Scc1 (kleisin family)